MNAHIHTHNAIAAKATLKFMQRRPIAAAALKAVLYFSSFLFPVVGERQRTKKIKRDRERTVGCSLVKFGTIHDYYLHSAIIKGHCLIFM